MGSAKDPPNPNRSSGAGYYRAQAEYCRQQAEQTEDQQVIRQQYLDLAAKWEGLARTAETG